MRRAIRKPTTIRPTIFDIARECNVSPATVSRALRNQPYVNDEKRRKIERVAKKLGYRASAVARTLRTQHSSSVGVLLADITNPVFARIVKGIDDVLIKEDCTLFLCNTEEKEERQLALSRSLIDRQVDGLILVSQTIRNRELIDLLKIGPPCVMIYRRNRQWKTDFVSLDNAKGIADAVNYLIALGHRRIGYITGPAESTSSQQRLKSFKATLSRHQLPFDKDIVFPGDYSMECGQQACARFMALREPPTAILATNDFSALGVIEEGAKMGIKIPEQLSVVGFDDIFISSLSNINLTTIRQPQREIGIAAAELLLKRIKSKSVGKPKEIILPTEFKIRGTCAPIRTPTLVSG